MQDMQMMNILNKNLLNKEVFRDMVLETFSSKEEKEKYVRLVLGSPKDIEFISGTMFKYKGKYVSDLVKYLEIKMAKKFDLEEVKGEDTGDAVVLRSKKDKSEFIIQDFKGKITFEYITK
jgi:hypothetical protein